MERGDTATCVSVCCVCVYVWGVCGVCVGCVWGVYVFISCVYLCVCMVHVLHG